ncbi:hypothetical protein GYH30_018072 [Glycine max]|nr:hypothetical protein GYH30_018072 [Glycine max]
MSEEDDHLKRSSKKVKTKDNDIVVDGSMEDSHGVENEGTIEEKVDKTPKGDGINNVKSYMENLLMTEGDRVFTYYQSLLKKMEVLEEKYAKSLEARVEDEGELDPCPTIPRDSGGV